mgnify:CR=1 FL=1
MGATEQLDRALQAATQSFEQRANALLASLQDTVAQSHTAQVQADQQRLETWSRSMEGMAGTVTAELQRAGAQAAEQQLQCGDFSVSSAMMILLEQPKSALKAKKIL